MKEQTALVLVIFVNSSIRDSDNAPHFLAIKRKNWLATRTCVHRRASKLQTMISNICSYHFKSYNRFFFLKTVTYYFVNLFKTIFSFYSLNYSRIFYECVIHKDPKQNCARSEWIFCRWKNKTRNRTEK